MIRLARGRFARRGVVALEWLTRAYGTSITPDTT